MKFRNMFLKDGYQSQAGEEPGGAGGAAATFTQAQLDEAVARAVAEQTAGLKAKNGEVIGDNKKLKEQLARFDGIDPEQVRAILKNFADGEEAKLIAEGKIDEVLAKRTDKLKGEHQKQLQGKDEEIGTLSARVQKLSALAVNGALAAAAGEKGALPESMEAIQALAKGVFVTDDEGNVVALDADGDVVFGKDGKAATVVFACDGSISITRRDFCSAIWTLRTKRPSERFQTASIKRILTLYGYYCIVTLYSKETL